MKTSDIKLKNLYGPCHDKKHLGMWRLEATNSKAYKIVTRAELEYLLKLPYSIAEYPKDSGNFVARPYVGKGKQAHIHLEDILAEAALAGAAEEVKEEPAATPEADPIDKYMGKPFLKLWCTMDYYSGRYTTKLYSNTFGSDPRDEKAFRENGNKLPAGMCILTENEAKEFHRHCGRYKCMYPSNRHYKYWKKRVQDSQ